MSISTLTRCSSTPSVDILVKAAGSTRRTRPASVPGSAPVFDGDLRAGVNFDGIGAEHVDDHFQVARIADFKNWRARLHDCFALLRHLENEA